ncbi:MAG: dipeptidase [Pseudomonadales bacterium]
MPRWILSGLGLLLVSCATTETVPQNLAQTALVVDTHIDVPYRLHRVPADVAESTDGGDFDYPRAMAGGLNAAFMSIYIPAAVDEAGEAFAFAEQLIDQIESLATRAPTRFVVTTCTTDVQQVLGTSTLALPLGMENGGPIMGSMEKLKHFRDRGVRYITLTHSKSNHIADSSYDDNRRWQGLSEFGKRLIPEMNRLGIMVDVSHVSDAAFWQALELSQVPVIASHSSLRHFTPGFERNMSDDMVRALGKAGGVIQINYGSSFLTADAQAYSRAAQAAAAAYRAEQDLAADAPELKTFALEYRAQNPYPRAQLNDVLDHIDRAVSLAGIDAVGVGSDYDGVGDSLPTGLEDVSSYPNLVAGLRGRDYGDEAIEKILGANVMRVWRQVESYAAAQGQPPQCRGA